MYDQLGYDARKGQLGAKFLTPEELTRKFRKWKISEDPDANMQSILRGTGKIVLSAANLPDLISKRTILGETYSFSLTHSYKTFLSDSLEAVIEGTASSSSGASSSLLSLSLKYLINNNLSAFCKVHSTLYNNFIHFGLSRRISPDMEANISGQYYFFGHEIEGSITRTLTERWNGFVALKLATKMRRPLDSPVPSFRFGTNYKKEKNRFGHSAELTADGGISTSICCTRRLSKKSWVNLSTSIGLQIPFVFGLSDLKYSFSVGVGRKISFWIDTKISISFSFSEGAIWMTIGFSKHRYKFDIPIVLSYDVSWQTITVFSLIPTLIGFLAHRLWIIPQEKKHKIKLKEEKSQDQVTKLQQKKEKSEAYCRAILSSAEKLKSEEKEKSRGLEILNGFYGNFSASSDQNYLRNHITQLKDKYPKVIDVTHPLQLLVKESRLSLSEGSKVDYLGFYDCCYDEPKFLGIVYSFGGVIREIVVRDKDPVSIPRASD
eukprot:TRINITY_DN11755_c0_g1_i1.p1 TRINITY_DN11755_c0_g1~~TRINITY_DN11755_c0_g1_i1.p1  ORF type:complete len:546 (-),score=61.70 TRINITY_DN11755_c0_g1_i1:37-1509(-)